MGFLLYHISVVNCNGKRMKKYRQDLKVYVTELEGNRRFSLQFTIEFKPDSKNDEVDFNLKHWNIE